MSLLARVHCIRLAPIVLILILLPCSRTQATTLIAKDAETLTAEAASVVHVRAIAVSNKHTADAKSAFTQVKFQVIDSLKGRDSIGSSLNLSFEGGTLPSGRTLHLHGCPEFKVGDEAILFVARYADQSCPLVGWEQGALFIREDKSGRGRQVLSAGRAVQGIEHGRLISVGAEKRTTIARPKATSSLRGTPSVMSRSSGQSAAGHNVLTLEQFKTQLRELISRTPNRAPRAVRAQPMLNGINVTTIRAHEAAGPKTNGPRNTPLRRSEPSKQRVDN